MNTNNWRNSKRGTTLVELLVAVSLVVGFFVSIFEVNGICLRYIRASKTNLAVVQGIQDRLEQLRNMTYTSLTTASSVQSLMATPANGSEFLARIPTEVVTLTGYQSISNYFAGTADATKTQITLAPGASSATINTTDGSLSSAAIIEVKVAYTWNEIFGGRSRSEDSETLISAGTRK